MDIDALRHVVDTSQREADNKATDAIREHYKCLGASEILSQLQIWIDKHEEVKPAPVASIKTDSKPEAATKSTKRRKSSKT